jgi:hypothetical protein
MGFDLTTPWKKNSKSLNYRGLAPIREGSSRGIDGLKFAWGRRRSVQLSSSLKSLKFLPPNNFMGKLGNIFSEVPPKKLGDGNPPFFPRLSH